MYAMGVLMTGGNPDDWIVNYSDIQVKDGQPQVDQLGVCYDARFKLPADALQMFKRERSAEFEEKISADFLRNADSQQKHTLRLQFETVNM